MSKKYFTDENQNIIVGGSSSPLDGSVEGSQAPNPPLAQSKYCCGFESRRLHNKRNMLTVAKRERTPVTEDRAAKKMDHWVKKTKTHQKAIEYGQSQIVGECECVCDCGNAIKSGQSQIMGDCECVCDCGNAMGKEYWKDLVEAHQEEKADAEDKAIHWELLWRDLLNERMRKDEP